MLMKLVSRKTAMAKMKKHGISPMWLTAFAKVHYFGMEIENGIFVEFLIPGEPIQFFKVSDSDFKKHIEPKIIENYEGFLSRNKAFFDEIPL